MFATFKTMVCPELSAFGSVINDLVDNENLVPSSLMAHPGLTIALAGEIEQEILEFPDWPIPLVNDILK